MTNGLHSLIARLLCFSLAVSAASTAASETQHRRQIRDQAKSCFACHRVIPQYNRNATMRLAKQSDAEQDHLVNGYQLRTTYDTFKNAFLTLRSSLFK